MAEIKKTLDMNRVVLADAVPLKSPLSMYIEPTRFCNFKCSYCVHSTRGEVGGLFERMGLKQEHISQEMYDKVVREIMLFPEQPKRITFSGMGEPLMNPQLGEMARKLNAAGYTGAKDVITNGLLLTREKAQELVDAQMRRIQISVQGVNGKRYKDTCGVEIDMDEYVDNIRWLFEHRGKTQVFVKIIDAILNDEAEKAKFFETFENICDNIFVEHLVVIVKGTREFLKDVDESRNLLGDLVPETKCCSIMTYFMNVYLDGNVMPCSPPGLPASLALGNVKMNTLQEIWYGKTHMELLRRNLKEGYESRQECVGCTCQKASYHPNEVIDHATDAVLARLDAYEKERLAND